MVRLVMMGAATMCLVSPVSAQRVLDRADPAANTVERAVTPPAKTPAPDPVVVETRAAAIPTLQRNVTIGAITFTGLRALTPATFANVIEPWLGKLATPRDLATLTSDIAKRARAKGYVFASASIERQRLESGVLVMTVDEGRIDAIRLDGPDDPAVRAALEPLVTGAPVTLAELERRLLLAGDLDGVRIRSSRWVREGDQGVLIVKVERTAIRGRVALRNDGSRPLGPVQLTGQVELAGLLAGDDALTLSYAGTPLQPSELNYGRIRYAKRVSRDGTELSIAGSASASHPGAYLERLDLSSRNYFGSIGVLQPLVRRREGSLWTTGELSLRDLNQDRDGDPARRDRLTVARLGLYGFAQAGGGRLRAGLTVSRDPLASRNDADGTFTSLGGWAEWTRTLIKRVSLRAGMEAQVAAEPLLVSEEIGLGGTGYLRAYDWSERSGDKGAMGVVELRYDLRPPFGLRSGQLYVFADGGHVANLHDGFGGGALASAGGGLRADIVRGLGASVEVAVPLTGERYDSGNRAPRLSFGLVKSF
jgi:hemolysin activation/secretion protein